MMRTGDRRPMTIRLTWLAAAVLHADSRTTWHTSGAGLVGSAMGSADQQGPIESGHQLGKLRTFAAGSGADLGELPSRGLLGFGCFRRDSPLFPTRSGAVAVRPLVAAPPSPPTGASASASEVLLGCSDQPTDAVVGLRSNCFVFGPVLSLGDRRDVCKQVFRSLAQRLVIREHLQSEQGLLGVGA